MTPLEFAFGRLLKKLPDARFVQKAAVATGRLPWEDAEQEVHYVSIYRHAIASNFLPMHGFNFIISNGFLTSHAYNIALAWSMLSGPTEGDGDLYLTLRHNYKKFYAESILGERNCLIGRALLIETLMFEQDCMRPIFAKVESAPELREKALVIAHLIVSFVNWHEMTHYFMHRSSRNTLRELAQAFDGEAGEAYARIAQAHGADLAEEVACDLSAVHQLLTSADEPFASWSDVERARLVAFSVMVISDLVSLEGSARETAKAARADDAQISLGSELRPQNAFNYSIGRWPPMEIRVNEVLGVLERHSSRLGHDLYGDRSRDVGFPLPESTRKTLARVWEDFMSPGAAGDKRATDAQQRGLAQLLAEALHGYDGGAEHLLWRSKRFSVGGRKIDP